MEVQFKGRNTKNENFTEAKVILSKNLDNDYLASNNNFINLA